MINPIEHERNQLLDIIDSIRQALGTPENASITHHAAQVVAEAQRAREDLAQARTMLQQAHDAIAMLQSDLRTANEMLQESRTEAVRAALPWDTFYGVVYGMGDDCMEDLQQWFLMHAPQEVRG